MHVFTKVSGRILLLSLIISLTNIYSYAQDNSSNGTEPVVTNAKGGVITVTGTVKEASSGKALAGINISVPGYSATLTDDNGFFSIAVPDNSTALIVAGPGYQRREVSLKGKVSFDISLFEDSYKSVNDEAPMPYGNVPLNHIVHSVTSINTNGNWERTAETPVTYLQGRVSGLNVVRRSGTPSIGADLFLRGFNSLYATNQQLYVVDGIIYDVNSFGNSLFTGHATNPLADIDIKDIDNITVIKDGASMYGTRG